MTHSPLGYSGRREHEMRTRSQSRKLADPPVGSGPRGGSGGPMTRARCTRSLATPLLPFPVSMAIQLQGCSGGGESRRRPKWRDWANLPPELIEQIAVRLLCNDVSEYLRLRSACKPWRKCTDDPGLCGGGLDPRFRPRDWIAVSHCTSPSHRRLINIRTGARAEVDRPELSTHHCCGIVDGLLLCYLATGAVRLLNPLTGTLVSFPSITEVRGTTQTPAVAFKTYFYPSEPLTEEEMRVVVIDAPKKDVKAWAINGAGIDDSTSPPTLILAIRGEVRRIICAKPGDQYWVSVHFGEQRLPEYRCNGHIYFHTLLSFQRHCYVATYRGDVMMVDLRGPRLVYCLSQVKTVSFKTAAYSYLIRSQDHKMLMVRFLSYIDLAHDFYRPEDFFMSQNGWPSRIEVFEVDIVGRQLIPLEGIGNYVAFVGQTYSALLSVDKFPKLARNAVYLNHHVKKFCHLGIYHFEDKRISPPRELPRDAHGELFPCACHWDLADYLIFDVERRYCPLFDSQLFYAA